MLRRRRPPRARMTLTLVKAPAHAPGLLLDGVSRRFGGALALAPLTLQIELGAIAVVAGPNGSGKTTLLRLAAGVVAPTTGRRSAPSPALYLRSGDGGRSV